MGILKIPQVGGDSGGRGRGRRELDDRPGVHHETRIGYGTKIDNQVQIGHNCTIGKFCLICGCVGIAGSVTIGDGVHARRGRRRARRDQDRFGRADRRRSQVGEDAPPGAQLMGYTAFPIRNFIKSHAYFRRLPELARRLAALERNEGRRRTET
jgi:UDP-3-O-[3-hydroxymyristoyl] glucosamine N-acyltransferase